MSKQDRELDRLELFEKARDDLARERNGNDHNTIEMIEHYDRAIRDIKRRMNERD